MAGSFKWLFGIFITTTQNIVRGRNDFDWGFGFYIVLIGLGHSVGLRTVVTLTWLNSTV